MAYETSDKHLLIFTRCSSLLSGRAGLMFPPGRYATRFCRLDIKACPKPSQHLALALSTDSDCIASSMDRLCGLVVRVPGYTTELYCVPCEVRTEFVYVM
jgi:hypothetical protein